MIPALHHATGALPIGRFICDMAEVDATFVGGYPGSSRRPQIWQDWLAATELLRSLVPVRYAWLSGSFLTTRPEPDDIDVVYFVEDADLIHAANDPDAAMVIQAFATSGLKAYGLKIDSFVVAWRSNPESRARGPEDIEYCWRRGYWDDLWLRIRSGPKGAQRTRLDSIPRRGYLEVDLDGFPERTS